VINPTTGSNPQVLVPATVTVTPYVVSDPASLNFAFQIGGGAPASQSIQISTPNGESVQISTANSSGTWLSVTPATASAPAAATVSVSPAGLIPGIYTARVVIVARNTGGMQTWVPVTLMVSDGAPISVTPTALQFTYHTGSGVPASQSIQVSVAGSATASFTVTQTGGSEWLSVTPASGNTPAAPMVSISPAGLTPGSYAANIIVTPGTGGNADTLIPVTLVVAAAGAAPAPTITGVTNAGSYSLGAVSPGEIVSIFGSALGPDDPAFLALDATGKVATSIGGVTVSVGGYLAPLTYVGSTQINAIVPYEVAASQSAMVEVTYGGQTSNLPTLQLTSTAPAIFTQNGSGTGPGAILNPDSSLNTEANPAAAGSVVQIYMTGEGLTTPAQATGAVTAVNTSGAGPLTPAPQQAVSVTIGGQPAPLRFSGEAPGDVAGVLQVNVTVPAVSAGANPITVQVGANTSQDGVTVWVK
jgi:uncharacterized protein (TIGR03437 family)